MRIFVLVINYIFLFINFYGMNYLVVFHDSADLYEDIQGWWFFFILWLIIFIPNIIYAHKTKLNNNKLNMGIYILIVNFILLFITSLFVCIELFDDFILNWFLLFIFFISLIIFVPNIVYAWKSLNIEKLWK